MQQLIALLRLRTGGLDPQTLELGNLQSNDAESQQRVITTESLDIAEPLAEKDVPTSVPGK